MRYRLYVNKHGQLCLSFGKQIPQNEERQKVVHVLAKKEMSKKYNIGKTQLGYIKQGKRWIE